MECQASIEENAYQRKSSSFQPLHRITLTFHRFYVAFKLKFTKLRKRFYRRVYSAIKFSFALTSFN